jgi:acyl-CoA thioester hydrolase
MPAVFEWRHTVLPNEIDEQGHVGNVEYLRWLLSSAVAHSAAQGWTKERYLDLGAVFVVQSHHIEYLQSAFEGDEIRVLTWVANFHKYTSLRKYQVLRIRDSKLLVQGATNWAFVSWPRRLPRRFPAELVEAFPVVSENEERSISSFVMVD